MGDDFNDSTVSTSAINLIASIGSAFVSGLVLILLVSIALPNQIGIYTGMLFVGEASVVLAVLGINEAATWRIAGLYGGSQQDDVPSHIRGFLTITCSAAILMSLFLAMAAPILTETLLGSSTNPLLLTVVAIGVAFRTIGTTTFGVLRGQHKIRIYSGISFLAILVGQTTGLVLFYFGGDIVFLAAGWTLGGIMQLISLRYVGILGRGARCVRLPDLTLVKYSVGILASHILLFFSRWSDRYLLLLFSTTYEVGIYTMPATLWTFVTYIPLALYTSLVPKLTRFNEQRNTVACEEILRAGMSILLFVLCILTIFTLALAHPILLFFGGPEYTQGTLPLQILAIGFPLYGMSLILGGFLKAMGKASETVLCLILGVISGFAIGVILVPAYGIIGAAISNTAAQVVIAGTSVMLVKRIVPNWIDRRPLVLFILSSIPAFLMMWLVSSVCSNYLQIGFTVCVSILLEILLWRRLGVVKEEWIALVDPFLPPRLTRIVRRILIRNSEAQCE